MKPLQEKTLTQLVSSISVDAEEALRYVQRMIEPAPFSDPALLTVETLLRDIGDAAEAAEKRERQIGGLLAGPWLCGDGNER